MHGVPAATAERPQFSKDTRCLAAPLVEPALFVVEGPARGSQEGRLSRDGIRYERGELETTLGHLAREGQIVDLVLQSGDRALVLRIDVISRYGGSLVQAARTHPSRVPVLDAWLGRAPLAGMEIVYGACATTLLIAVMAGLLIQIIRRSFVLPMFRDTQCGFKGFRRDAARAIFTACAISSFAFDIEVLFLARKLGFKVKEVRVAIERREGSTYSLRKHLLPFVHDVMEIRLHELRGHYG